MGRLGNRYLPLAALAVTLASCTAGFQGGVIPEKFNGITSVEAISPESIQLSWNTYPGSTQYRLYASESNSAIAQPQFKSIIFKPNIATAATTRYAVTAVDPSNGLEQGSRTAYVGPVALLPRFDFKNTGTAAPVEAAGINGTKLKISWTGFPKVTYRVYLGERSPDGIVNYAGFTASTKTEQGTSSTVITGLLPGHEYCSVMVADYADNTKDGPDGTPFTTDITTTLNGWLTGPSATFGDSKVALSQKCARTSSSLVVDRVKVFSQKAFLSTRPVFYVYDADHPVENDPASGFEASIYQVDNTSGLATYVGKTNGTGQIIALTNLSPGRYKFYAMVKSTAGSSIGALAKKELIVGTETAEPTETNRKWIYIRGFPDLETPSNALTQGYYPEKQQDSLGSQRLGSSVAMGDFDCDGKYDIAVGIPNATETSPRDNRSAQMGKVIVYYDIDDAVTPNTTTRSKIITFDITPYDSAARDLQLGTSLFVGNFNKDNQRTNQNNPTGQPSFQCHDLVIGSGYGPMFVLYGKRNVSGFDGGLNYSGSTGYAVNPSSSCDTSSNVCSAALYTMGAMNTKIGVSLASGNFNGSGYEDLVATTKTSAGVPSGTLVFRGSENGLIPPAKWTGSRTFAQGCTEDYTTYPFPDGPKKGYPYLPSDRACFDDNTAGGFAAASVGWGQNSFGKSVAAFPNSYYDLNGNGTGTRRIRDTLLIGNPDYVGTSIYNAAVLNTKGRVYVCRPTTDSSVAVSGLSPLMTFDNSVTTYDMNDYFQWKCAVNNSVTSSIIDSPLNGVGSASAADVNVGSVVLGYGFGSALQGIRNPLLYDKTQLTSDGNTSSTSINLGFPGAVAIGASDSSKVFIYYGVHFPEGGTSALSDGTATRDNLGASRNNQFTNLVDGNHAGGVAGGLKVVSEHPCRVVDISGVVQNSFAINTPYREKCDVQVITPPSGADWSTYGFGKSLFAVMGSNATTGFVDKQSVLAVPAPTRDIASSGSVVFTALGSVQLYYQNVVSESNGFPARTKTSSSSCDFCRFSDGFSNAGSSSIDFDGTKRDNIQFGGGGVAAGPLQIGSASTYNSSSDLIAGVPGYVLSRNGAQAIDSGAVQILFSHNGQFRPYQFGASSTINSPWHFIDTSYGQESDIRFFQTVNLGDIDQDNLDDIAVRVKLGGENHLRIMKGKPSTSGALAFKATSPEYVDFQVQSDKTAGMRIVPLGRISTSQFPGFLITGKTASYIYFGGIGGLIQGQPSAYATAGAPRKFTAPFYGYLDFSDQSIYNPADVVSGADYGQSVTHGDFNGDGYEDVAIGFNNNISSLSDGTVTPVTYSGMVNENLGRVMIFYGGKDNGFQVQADSNGGYPLKTSYFAPYSLLNGVTGSPCQSAGAGLPYVCNKIQVLYEGPNASSLLNTYNYGRTLTSIPAGACTDAANVSHPVSSLLVQSALRDGTSRIYVYKPQCVLGTDSTIQSGLVQDGVNVTVASVTTFKSVINPTNATDFGTVVSTSNTFGNSMTSVPGIFGSSALAGTDAKTHLVLTDSTRKLLVTMPLVSSNCTYSSAGVAIAGTGSCQIELQNDPVQGYQKVSYAAANVFAGNVGFGGTVANIGDVNGDGFADIALSLTSMTRPGTPNTSTGAQGGVMVVFGADKARFGLQTLTGSTVIEPALNSACYLKSNGATTVSVCSPSLLFAPQPDATRDGSGDSIYLSRDSKLNFGLQNEGLGSFLFGVPMRDTRETSSANRILRGGAFYVLP